MRLCSLAPIVAVSALVCGCGGKSTLFSHTPRSSAPPVTLTVVGSASSSPKAGVVTAAGLGFPLVATKNTTRVAGANAIENAAAVALAVYPSGAPGTHPGAVVLAPQDDWQAALASASLMGAPFRAPLLLSGPGALPRATSAALRQLAPTGESNLGGAQVLTIGDVPSPAGVKADPIGGSDPFALAAAIDAFETKARGRPSVNVMVASASSPRYAMPAAGYAAESGEPLLFVDSGDVPAATRTALGAHHHPHIYVLGPPSAVSDQVLAQLSRYGVVRRVGADDASASSVAFAAYRDPACPTGQPCAHIPHSFGWAIRSPGHAYVLINASDTLEAAAAAALSSSGGYGPQLLVEDPNTLPKPVLDYFLNYATPGYTQEGPTAAVYNHGWLIGDASAISPAVQSQVDSLLEVVPQK